MKRLTAICFLLLLLFNIAGYRLWFYYAERQSTAQLIAAVEAEQYESSELITLEVPLNLPYQTDWSDWEKVRGQIEVEGVTYQYVQRKVEQGKLVLQCLPNKNQAKIESARDRFFQLANSFQNDHADKKNDSNKTVQVTKPSLTDFDDHAFSWGIAHCMQNPVTSFKLNESCLPQFFLPVSVPPPNRMV